MLLHWVVVVRINLKPRVCVVSLARVVVVTSVCAMWMLVRVGMRVRVRVSMD